MTLDEALVRAARAAHAIGNAGYSTEQATRFLCPPRRYGKTRHARLVERRHELLLAADTDSVWRPWRKRRRLAALAAVEADLATTGFPW